MFGLGKPRTELGRFIDRANISQGELVESSGVSKNEISRLCSSDVTPRSLTMIKIIGALRRLGHDVTMEDFW